MHFMRAVLCGLRAAALGQGSAARLGLPAQSLFAFLVRVGSRLYLMLLLLLSNFLFFSGSRRHLIFPSCLLSILLSFACFLFSFCFPRVLMFLLQGRFIVCALVAFSSAEEELKVVEEGR